MQFPLFCVLLLTTFPRRGTSLLVMFSFNIRIDGGDSAATLAAISKLYFYGTDCFVVACNGLGDSC
uniref:Secreted protein n=1 Tax=Heterorhabditis bacteriophora TaxID=37862 RepID=A0A1I7WGX1_HETBA